jgi:hypothetical protein
MFALKNTLLPINGFIKSNDEFPIQKSPFFASFRKSAALR